MPLQLAALLGGPHQLHYLFTRAKLQKLNIQCLRTVAVAYKATLIQSLQAEMGISPQPLNLDGRQARVILRSAKSETDKVIEEGVQKASCIRA
jgi:hypothetical protein